MDIDTLTVGMRIRIPNPFNIGVRFITGTVVGMTPKGQYVYIRHEDGTVRRWLPSDLRNAEVIE
jgi:hypothetical protein